jgi:GT2 family glycosyltransferase
MSNQTNLPSLNEVSLDVKTLNLRPLEQDPRAHVHTSGESCWKAYTCDAAFSAEVSSVANPLSPGWYCASIAMHPLSGFVAGPRLYIPEEDGGYSETNSVELCPVGDNYVAEFYLPRSAELFRFDPSIYPCEFTCSEFTLTPTKGKKVLASAVSRARRFRLPSSRLFVQWCRTGTRLLRTQGLKELSRAIYQTWLIQTDESHREYTDWLVKFSMPTGGQREDMVKACQEFKYQPLVSFITPVYNTPEKYLREAIESVLAQIYPNWELCLANDASSLPHVCAVLDEYAVRDSRIKVIHRDSNGHISAASNSALSLAGGEFIALLDHDDTVTPDALFWMVNEINEHPNASLLYSDEDKLDREGLRTSPYFKCDWNYDLFLSHNLVTHLGVYRTGLVKELGGFRTDFDGSQDYDLALRVIERIDTSQIRHVPRVLYQWRMVPGSTAIGAEQKSYAAERARKAIEEHLHREHIDADVETIPELATQRVRYKIPLSAPLVSIIVPTRNAHSLVRQCIDSIHAKTTYRNFEILLVNNGSDDVESLSYFEQLHAHGVVRLLDDPGAFNFSRINNDAARAARGEVLVFLNNDIEVITPDWLSELVSHALRPGVGAVGAKLWYPNDTIQHAGLILVAGLAGHAHLGRPRGDHGYFSRASLTQAYIAVTGACLCIQKKTFDACGGFDESLAVAFNDVDLCLRLYDRGYRNIFTPFAELYHHESATRGYEDTPEKMSRFKKEANLLQERWMTLLVNDPFYSPNLSLTGQPFTPAWPPRVPPLRKV